VEEEDPVVAAALGCVLSRAVAREDPLELPGGGGEVLPTFRDGDLQEHGLEVGAVLGQGLVRDGVGAVELLQLPQRPSLEVEREAVLRVGLEHGLRFGQGLLGPPGAQERLAQRQPEPDAVGLQLQRLPVAGDRLVPLLRAGVDVAQGLVGAGVARLQLQRLLEGGRGLLGLAHREVLGPELDEGVEVARVHLEVPLPGAGGLRVLLELP
jgi:hypothetical protein